MKTYYIADRTCLTKGVIEAQGEEITIKEIKYIKANANFTLFHLGFNIFETREEAVARAEAIRDRQVKSLLKSIAIMSNLKF